MGMIFSRNQITVKYTNQSCQNARLIFSTRVGISEREKDFVLSGIVQFALAHLSLLTTGTAWQSCSAT